MTINVVVVEDSIAERDRLVRALQADGDIRVIGQARRAQEAIDRVSTERARRRGNSLER